MCKPVPVTGQIRGKNQTNGGRNRPARVIRWTTLGGQESGNLVIFKDVYIGWRGLILAHSCPTDDRLQCSGSTVVLICLECHGAIGQARVYRICDSCGPKFIRSAIEEEGISVLCPKSRCRAHPTRLIAGSWSPQTKAQQPRSEQNTIRGGSSVESSVRGLCRRSVQLHLQGTLSKRPSWGC